MLVPFTVQEDNDDDGEFNALILSYVFWPVFKDEKITLPEVIKKWVRYSTCNGLIINHYGRKMDAYCKQYEALKGMRTLDWIPSLGLVKLDLELANGTQSFSVSPTRATVIHHFESQGTNSIKWRNIIWWIDTFTFSLLEVWCIESWAWHFWHHPEKTSQLLVKPGCPTGTSSWHFYRHWEPRGQQHPFKQSRCVWSVASL